MKKMCSLLVIASLLVFATLALAQDPSIVPGAQKQLAVVQGAKTSVYADNITGGIPAFPAWAVVANVPLPRSYNSLRKFLVIDVTLQSFPNAGDTVSSAVVVVMPDFTEYPAFPDPGLAYYFENQNETLYETRGRKWFLIPEVAGGTAVIPRGSGATIEVRVTSLSGTAVYGTVSVIAEVVK